jgi:hypothetical protein
MNRYQLPNMTNQAVSHPFRKFGRGWIALVLKVHNDASGHSGRTVAKRLHTVDQSIDQRVTIKAAIKSVLDLFADRAASLTRRRL